MATLLSVLAVDADSVRTGALVAIVVVVLLGALAVKMFVNTVVRIITVAVVVGLGGAIWTQREELADCVDKAQDLAEVSVQDVARGSISCTFFGVTVDVPLPVGVN